MSGLWMKKKLLVAMGAAAVGFAPVVQSRAVTNTAMATTQAGSFLAPAGTGPLVYWGVLKNATVAGSAVSVVVTDDKSSTGWTSISTDPGGGSGVKVFIAWNMAPISGVTTMTATFTGGLMQILGGVAELTGATAAGSSGLHTSGGVLETAGGPVVVTNGAVNTTAHAVAFHVCCVDLFSNTIALVCTPGTGSFVVLNSNQQAQPVSTALATGVLGYTLDTAATTDSVSDAWTASACYICSLNKTILF